MEKPANELIVNSKGHCFFCLSIISFKSTPVKLEGGSMSMSERDSSSFLHPLHYLSQYLGMDLTKVFNQKGSISPSLLAKVEQSRLKAELCEDCSKLSNSISVLCKRMEKLRMEIDCKLSRVHDKLLTADKLGRGEELRRFGRLGEDEGLMEVLQVLRTEAREKCSNRSYLGPRVKVQKLTRQEIKARSGIQNKTKRISESNMDTESGLGLQSNNQVKMEDRNDESVLDESGGNDFLGDMAGISDDGSVSEAGHLGGAATTRVATTIDASSEYANTGNFQASTTGTEKPKYSIVAEKGKYKCGLCSKEYGPMAFRYHYKSVHLKIRYKCNLCEKIFTQKQNYNVHVRVVHLGVRFKCLACNQEYTDKRNLERHQRKNMCNLILERNRQT